MTEFVQTYREMLMSPVTDDQVPAEELDISSMQLGIDGIEFALQTREQVRSMMPHGEFVEAYCQCDIDICTQRDPKGLYAKAIKGEIPNFTGISAPYEEPLRPEITVSSGTESVEEGVKRLIALLEESGKIGV